MNRLTEIEARLSAIVAEAENAEGEALAALEEEQRSLIEERSRLTQEAQTRRDMAARIANLGVTIETAPPEGEQRTLEQVRASSEYADAYVAYLRDGNAEQVRSLLSDLVEGGTVPTPIVVQEAVETAWENAILVSRIRHISVAGTIKIPFELSATGAAKHIEGTDAPAEETLTLGIVTISPVMLKKWITISDEVAALKGEAFLNYINAEIAQRIAELADEELVGTIKAAPAESTATAVGVAKLAVEKIDATTIFQAQALLSDDARNPVAIMNRKTYFGKFMSLTDLQGRPIYSVVSDNGKPSYYINGIEVLFSSKLEADKEIIVGDLDGAVANFPEGEGVVFKYDDKSLMEKDLVKILGREYVGFGVTKPGYFVNVTIGG